MTSVVKAYQVEPWRVMLGSWTGWMLPVSGLAVRDKAPPAGQERLPSEALGALAVVSKDDETMDLPQAHRWNRHTESRDRPPIRLRQSIKKNNLSGNLSGQ